MTKTTQTKPASGEEKKRLEEIAQIKLEALSDDEVLRLLAERKRLVELERAYEKAQREAEKMATEKKKETILKKIAELNKSISPEKQDDDLLVLVAKRKELEAELAMLEGVVAEKRAPDQEEVSSSADATANDAPEETTPGEEENPSVPEEAVIESEDESVQSKEKKDTPPVLDPPAQKLAGIVEKEYGGEKIQDDGIQAGSQFSRYLDQLKSNSGSIGELLQRMPLDAKKNKAFMLQVARIDPAYAMHYADKEILKKDEDFNVRIASMSNPRNSGNALSEMLPEARTSKVILAGVKQDYRNIKFVQPDMEDYDMMFEIAKKGALEKIKNLKDATDVALLIPKALQQDKAFMEQVREIAPQ